MANAPKSKTAAKAILPTLELVDENAFAKWLAKNHSTSNGVWLRLAKKGSGIPSITYPEALDVALCYGWIDGQKQSQDDHYWLQKFTPRGPRSIWSKINREKVAKLIAANRMESAGHSAIERAKKNGQWEGAYDGPKTSAVPPDLQAELDKSKTAQAFFLTLESRNRYAILWRLQTAKKPETRAKRLADIAAMLKRKEKFHP